MTGMQSLETMSWGQLSALETRIKSLKDRQHNEAVESRRKRDEQLAEKIRKMAADFGVLPVSAAVQPVQAKNGAHKAPVKAKPAKRAIPVKFRNPEIKTETWTGRGRPPRWLQAKLNAGATLDNYRIAKA